MKRDKYLSKEYTNCVRGICAIVVIIHHLYQRTGLFSEIYIGELLQLSGALAVSVFFFFSGYGLMLSSQKKNYVKNFFRNKFLPLYCFYVFLIILYSFWTLCIEHTIPLIELVKSFLFGATVVSNGWYLQATFVLYLVYLFSFSVFNDTNMRILSVAVSILVYCIFCRFIGLGAWWYQTIPCVILGMLYCYNKPRIDIVLNKHVWKVFIASSVLFAIFYKIVTLYLKEPMYHTIYFVAFVCATISISYILCDTPIIRNSFFALCGKYSLEMYVSHGFFLRLIEFKFFNNKFIYILTVVIGTIIVSFIMKKIFTNIIPLIFKNRRCTYQ